ncbi:aldehyde dehydrogenase family protein [Candidatus Sumerlaeota bacterium]|nr:aldehyde dehydrogenase family protein [Candidatus Sumerlaeota bacterium]
MPIFEIPEKEYGLLLDGRWIKAGEPTDIRNPYDRRTIATVRRADAPAMNAAIIAAQRGFDRMRSLTTAERVTILERIASGLRSRAEEIAATITAEAGKPIALSRIEVQRGISTFEIAAHEVACFEGETLRLDIAAAGKKHFGLTRRFPIGLVAAITPFNFPLNLVAHKVAPAIAVGDPVILRPASQTPVTSLILGEIAIEAGLPDGGLNIAPSPVELAEELVADDRIKMVTFTGSPDVGWPLKTRAGKKKVALELGANCAAIVNLDADIELAIQRLAFGAFAYAGQICVSVQRIFLHEGIFDEFVEGFLRQIDVEIGVGNPADERVVCGPLITEADANRIEAWCEEALRAGSQRLLGGRRERSVLWPTVLTKVPRAMKVNIEEAFGPVVTLAPYHTFDQALDMANDSRYGLQAGIFTRDVHKIFHAFDRLEVGAVIANDSPTFRADNMPFGGVKDSGLGREGVRYAMEEMSELKLLALNLE